MADIPTWDEAEELEVSPVSKKKPETEEAEIPTWEEAEEPMEPGRARALGIAEDIIPGLEGKEVAAYTRALWDIATEDRFSMDDFDDIYEYYESKSEDEIKRAKTEREGDYYAGRAAPYLAAGATSLAKAGAKAALSPLKALNKIRKLLTSSAGKKATNKVIKKASPEAAEKLTKVTQRIKKPAVRKAPKVGKKKRLDDTLRSHSAKNELPTPSKSELLDSLKDSGKLFK